MSRKVKLKSLHLFMAMILLLGLLQPSLALAAESTNVEEPLVEEVDESVEAEETPVEEAIVETEESVEEEDAPTETEESTEEGDAPAAIEENAEEGDAPAEIEESVEEDDITTKTEESVSEIAGLTQSLNEDVDIEFSFELLPDRISQWELARGGVEFWLDAPNGRDATLTVGDETIEFETRYLHQDMLVVDLSPGTYDVEITIGNTTETEQLVVVSNEEYYEYDSGSNPRLESREMVLTKSEAEEIESIMVFADELHEYTSIDVLVNGERVKNFYHDWGSASAEIEVAHLPIGEHTIEFVHPTSKAEITLFIVPDGDGALAPAGTYEGITIQYMGGSNMLETTFELPIKFEVDENGIIKNLEVEYWWVCVLADGQSGFDDSVEMPDTQITVNQPFQINWEEGSSPRSLVGIIHEDGTAFGTFFSHSLSCGTGASEWNLESDTPPVPQPDPEIEFSFELSPDRISQWELVRRGIQFSVDGSGVHEGTVSFAGHTEEFTLEGSFEGTLKADLSPGTYPVTVTIGNTSKTLNLEVVSDDEFWEETTNPTISTGEVHVLTKSEAEELGSILVVGSDFYSPASIDVLVNGSKVETIDSDYYFPDTDIDISNLPIGEHKIEFIHPTGSASTTINIVSDESGQPAPAGTFEGLTHQYMAGDIELEEPFELPIKFEVDENGVIQNLEVEYWWLCTEADPGNQSGFTFANNMPPTQVTVNQPFQIDWNDASNFSLVGVINEDGTASGKFFAYSYFACGTHAADWSLVSDMAPDPVPEVFEVDLVPDTTGETDGPVTITVATTSDSDITSLKWLEGNRTVEDFDGAGNEIDLETKTFTVEENGTYTIFASNAEGVVALSTIEVSNIVEPDPIDPKPTDPEPTDPEPTDPEPTDPEPTDPEPTDPEPTDPEPTDPEPTDPEPTDPEPTDPEPTDPEPTDPEPTDPEPTDPEPTDPEPTDPEPTDPEPTDPEPTDPTDPGNGTDSGVSIDPDDDADSDDGTDQEVSIETDDDTDAEGNKLPSTSTDLFNLLAIGAIMLVISFALLMFRRKQNV